VAKVQGDHGLLEASRLPLLEEALIDLMVPAKQKIVREQTLGGVERVAGEIRLALGARERNVIEQLYELRSLQGKNHSSVERMTQRAYAEQREFEEVVRKAGGGPPGALSADRSDVRAFARAGLARPGAGHPQAHEGQPDLAAADARGARILRQSAATAAAGERRHA
jgi:hypothetical protein